MFIEEQSARKGTDQDKDIESLVNAVHLDTNGVLKCIISIGEEPRTHLYVF